MEGGSAGAELEDRDVLAGRDVLSMWRAVTSGF